MQAGRKNLRKIRQRSAVCPDISAGTPACVNVDDVSLDAYDQLLQEMEVA